MPQKLKTIKRNRVPGTRTAIALLRFCVRVALLSLITPYSAGCVTTHRGAPSAAPHGGIGLVDHMCFFKFSPHQLSSI